MFDGTELTRLARRALRRRRARLADRVPGSLRVAQPAHAGARDPEEGMSALGVGRTRRSASGASMSCWSRSGCRRRRRSLSARVLRRAAPAHRDRARARGGAEADRVRRADQRARRLGAGADPEPAEAPAARARARLPLHHAQPLGRRVPRARGRGDVPGAHRRARHGGRGARPTRSIPTRRRCSRPCRRWTAERERLHVRASCRRRRPRLPAAISIRAARTR